MNRISLGFVCVVLSTLIAAGCGMALEEYTEEIKGNPTQQTPPASSTGNKVSLIITNYNLQAYVPVPTTGAVPVKAVGSRVDVAATVVWKNQAGAAVNEPFNAFIEEQVYQADITLTAKNGYSFTPGMTFAYPDGAVQSQSAGDTSPEDVGRTAKRLVTVTHKQTAAPMTISGAVDLTNLIPLPVAGGMPKTSFITSQYSGTVSWAPADEVFLVGTGYKAEVTLYPAPGYIFPAPTQVIHNDSDSTSFNFAGEPRSGTIGFGIGSSGSAGIEIGWK
jgi:hypothetical protein